MINFNVVQNCAVQQSAPPAWQKALQQAICDPEQLLKLLALSKSELAYQIIIPQPFGLRVPKSYVNRMEKGNPNDPLLRQILPLNLENQKVANFHADPLAEHHQPTGLLHKYQGRVLLVVTGACAVYCRYCFRRYYPYSKSNLTRALAEIKQDKTIKEIILSGGDPLTLSDEKLAELITDIAAIPHIQRLRIHTRLPIILPERVTTQLLTTLTGTRLPTVIVVHANHPNEIDEQVGQALQSLVMAGVIVLNQSVLLNQINDTVDILIKLSETLFNYKVLPYYLHTLDKVQGAAHFDVSIEKTLELQEALQIALPGYLVPKFVTEIVGKEYKQLLQEGVTTNMSI